MSQLHTVLVAPIETEKAHAGQKDGKFQFRVSRTATKKSVKQAIEKYYGVPVKSVRMLTTLPKTRSVGRGRVITKRARSKKAIITTVGAKPIDVSKVKV